MRTIFHDLAFASDCADKITDEAIEAAGGSYSGWKRLALVQAKELAREREQKAQAIAVLDRFSSKCKCSICGVIREAVALLAPKPADTPEKENN